MIAQVDRHYATYGVGRLVRRLVSYVCFQGRPATTKGQWFNPVVFCWLRLLASVQGNPALNRPIFITGLGRSGTTILGILFSLHRDVGFLNEPKAIWHVIDPRQDINGNYSADNGRFRLEPEDVSTSLSLRAHRIFARYLRMVGARRLVDKYPELIFRVDYVRSIFPDARFIFITRNGVDACDSIVKWSQQKGTRVGDRVDDWWGRGDMKWRYIWKQLIETDRTYADVAALGVSSLDHANRAAMEWLLTMREGLAQCARHPEVVIRTSYESLLAEPERELERLQCACGLTLDPAIFSYAHRSLYDNPSKSWPKLLPPVKELFCETMKQLEYETSDA